MGFNRSRQLANFTAYFPNKSSLLTFYTKCHLSCYCCYLINIYSTAELEGKKIAFPGFQSPRDRDHAPEAPRRRGLMAPALLQPPTLIGSATLFRTNWNPCSAPVTYIPWVSCLVHWRLVSEDHKMRKWLPSYLQNRKNFWKNVMNNKKESYALI